NLGEYLFLGKGMNYQTIMPANLLADVYESLTAVEIDRADQRFVNVGQQVRRHDRLIVHPFAQEEILPQVEQSADAGTGPPADNGGLDLGHLPFLIIRKAEIELLAADQPE